MDKKIAKVEVRIPPEIKESFTDKCETHGKTVSETVRELIHGHINDEDSHLLKLLKNNIHLLLTISSFAVISLIFSVIFIFYEEPPKPKLLEVFTGYDVNKDKLLTLSDFVEFKRIKALKIAEGKSNLDSGFLTGELPSFISVDKFNSQFNPAIKLARYDLNLDGQVNIREFLASKPRLNFIAWPNFTHLDINGDEVLAKEELLSFAQQWYEGWPAGDKRAKLQTNAKLWQLDTDKSGTISFNEFNDSL